MKMPGVSLMAVAMPTSTPEAPLKAPDKDRRRPDALGVTQQSRRHAATSTRLICQYEMVWATGTDQTRIPAAAASTTGWLHPRASRAGRTATWTMTAKRPMQRAVHPTRRADLGRSASGAKTRAAKGG